ncbi:hypothetical protein BJX62DRAFT_245292 [Aspergillus germanicus]
MSITATHSITTTNSGPSLKVIKNGFGAEITGLDFANGYGFAVVRKTKLVDEIHLELASPRGEANKGNALFHTDSSFNPRRAGYSLLLAHELPPPGTGGSTAFADVRAAYRDLDPDFKQFLHEKNLIARHSLLHSKKMAAPECFKDIDPADHFLSRHLLLQVHERTGIPTIYLAKHIHSLEGVSAEESQAI